MARATIPGRIDDGIEGLLDTIDDLRGKYTALKAERDELQDRSSKCEDGRNRLVKNMAVLRAERDELQARIDKALARVIKQDIGSLDKIQAILEGE